MLGRRTPEKLTEREQVARRREEVLSRGRKFKYPLQYAKHRVAIIATIISVIALIALGTITYTGLYVFGSSSDVLYRLTEVLPLPVAAVDGEQVRFSDYLLLYRSSIAIVDKGSEDFKLTSAEYKRSSLDTAEKNAYAVKLARELNIEVSDEQVTKLFDAHRSAGGSDRSEESFLKILADNFGVSKSEYMHLLYHLLTRAEVSAAIDTEANRLRDEAYALVTNGAELSAVADQLGDAVSYEDTGGLISLGNVDGGRSEIAATLEPGEISQPFVSTSGDAYYIVKLIEKTPAEVSYASIEIPFTEFDRRFAEVLESKNYSEYISIEIPTTPEDSEEHPEEDPEN